MATAKISIATQHAPVLVLRAQLGTCRPETAATLVPLNTLRQHVQQFGHLSIDVAYTLVNGQAECCLFVTHPDVPDTEVGLQDAIARLLDDGCPQIQDC